MKKALSTMAILAIITLSGCATTYVTPVTWELTNQVVCKPLTGVTVRFKLKSPKEAQAWANEQNARTDDTTLNKNCEVAKQVVGIPFPVQESPDTLMCYKLATEEDAFTEIFTTHFERPIKQEDIVIAVEALNLQSHTCFIGIEPTD